MTTPNWKRVIKCRPQPYKWESNYNTEVEGEKEREKRRENVVYGTRERI